MYEASINKPSSASVEQTVRAVQKFFPQTTSRIRHKKKNNNDNNNFQTCSNQLELINKREDLKTSYL